MLRFSILVLEILHELSIVVCVSDDGNMLILVHQAMTNRVMMRIGYLRDIDAVDTQ